MVKPRSTGDVFRGFVLILTFGGLGDIIFFVFTDILSEEIYESGYRIS